MSIKTAVLLVINVIFFTNVVESGNVLAIFHYPSKSHHLLGVSLLKALAQHGHNVTIMSPFPVEEKIANFTSVVLEDMVQYKEDNMKQVVDKQKGSFLDLIRIMIKSVEETLTRFLENRATKNLLESDSKFDVIIINWVLSEALLGIAHHYNAPVIAYSTIGASPYVNWLTGAAAPYAYVPNVALPFSDDMTFLQRLANTFTGIFGEWMIKFWLIPYQEELLKKHFPEAPALEELLERVDLVLSNSHIIMETPRPLMPNVIPIGGYYLEEVEEMIGDIKTILDASKNGLIYFSLGTNIQSNTLTKEMLSELMKTFEKMPYDILWKFEDEDLPGKPSNVHIRKWVPQKGVLSHPNTKAFITHGGLGSVTEALYFGVPVIGIPFFGDQSRNMAEAIRQGFAVEVKSTDLSEVTLTNAIKEITTNDTYKINVETRSMIFKSQPVSQTKKAVFWIEQVMLHKGAKHMKTKATKLYWYQYFLLDVIGFTAAVLSITIYIIYFVLSRSIAFCVRKVRGRSKIKKN